MKKLSKENIKRMKEKGKEWFEKNKCVICFGAGCASSVAIAMIFGKYDKIKNTGIMIGPLQDENGIWDENVGIMTYGIDRFGNEVEGFKAKFNHADIVWIKNMLDGTEKIINEHNGN